MLPRSTSLLLSAVFVLVGCGGKTALPGTPVRDAGTDRGETVDTGPQPDGAVVEIDAEVCGDCDDGFFCTGREVCTAEGCVSLGIDCDDGEECTIDGCDEGSAMCSHTPVDRDEDGDGFSACGGDCDDSNDQLFPGNTETCDMLDNNCDGQIDEGVLSECGDCRQGCRVVDVPRDTGGVWEAPFAELNGLERQPDGTLQLSVTRSESRYAWIANTLTSTVTKLDLETGAQTGEFYSVLVGGDHHAAAVDQPCDMEAGLGNCPSRTAVDLRGNVFVANRTPQHQGTVTKIANDEDDCIDRNRNGRIDTSRDLNGNGRIDRFSEEFLGVDDECVLWTVDVGEGGGLPRAVAIDADGFVWVGLHEQELVVKLDPTSGALVEEFSLSRSSFHPYGAAIGGDGKLWLVEVATGRIISIDTVSGRIQRTRNGESRLGCSGNYGIAIDPVGRVWLAGFQCRHVARFDPRGNTWMHVDLPDSGGTRGIAADDRGFIYVAASHSFFNIGGGGLTFGEPIARVTRFRASDGGDVTIFGTPEDPLPGAGTVGVGLDSDRNIWMVNGESGSVTRLNPTTGESREFPVGDQPYTYSDFTGFALRTFTAPSGTVRTHIQGCTMGPTEWETLSWRGSTPDGSTIEVRVRFAPTEDALDSAMWQGPLPGTEIDLMGVDVSRSDAWIEVEFQLQREDGAGPSLRDYRVQFNCPVG